MTLRSLASYGLFAAGIALLPLLSADLAGQAPATAPAAKTAAALKRTSWGDPDHPGHLDQHDDDARSSGCAKRATRRCSAKTSARRSPARSQERLDQDKPGTTGSVVPYNEFWYERGTLNNRTALIVDPEDGRIPPLTPEGQKRWDDQVA